jgi:hypothetical protein
MIAVGFFQVQWSARCQTTLLSLQDKSGRKRLRLVRSPKLPDHNAAELMLIVRAKALKKELGAPFKPGRKGEYRADIFKVPKLPRELMREPLLKATGSEGSDETYGQGLPQAETAAAARRSHGSRASSPDAARSD